MKAQQVQLLRWLALGCALACADQASKWVITDRIVLHESVPVIPGFFRLTHVVNRGAAFGLRQALDMFFEEGMDNVFRRHRRACPS